MLRQDYNEYCANWVQKMLAQQPIGPTLTSLILLYWHLPPCRLPEHHREPVQRHTRR